jgi:hypothetical protein
MSPKPHYDDPSGTPERGRDWNWNVDGPIIEGEFERIRKAIPATGASAGQEKGLLDLWVDGDLRSIWLDGTVLVSKMTRELKRRKAAKQPPKFRPRERMRIERLDVPPGKRYRDWSFWCAHQAPPPDDLDVLESLGGDGAPSANGFTVEPDVEIDTTGLPSAPPDPRVESVTKAAARFGDAVPFE